MVDIKSSGD